MGHDPSSRRPRLRAVTRVTRETAVGAVDADNGAERTLAALQVIWEASRERVLGQVQVIEEAVTALLTDELDDTLRAAATREAHKLAGSAGMFGFPTTSARARELEHAFAPGTVLALQDALRLSEVVVALANELEAGPPARLHATPTTPPEHPVVLVVGVEADRFEELRAAAVERGLSMGLAATPALARAAVRAATPDLVVLDLVGISDADQGLALVSELSIGPPAVPVIVLGDREALVDRVDAARRGARGFLGRSLSVAETLDALHGFRERLRPTHSRILAVDDDPLVLESLGVILRTDGVEVATCDPATSGIPVILLTANRQGADRREFAELGVVAVLAKPFDPLTLAGQVADALGWAA